MRVRKLYNDALTTSVTLQDWVSEVERRLGSEQPMREEPKPLDEQLDQHKVRCLVIYLCTLQTVW